MAFHNKVCPHCGDKFLSRSTRGQFCTPDCGQKHRRSIKRAQEQQEVLNEYIDAIIADATQQ